MVIVQAFNGAGDTRTPTIINLFCFWIVQLPLAFWLSRGVHMGPRGAFFASLTTQVLLALIAIYVFRQGWWKRKETEEHTSELQSHLNLVCRLLLEKKKNYTQ